MKRFNPNERRGATMVEMAIALPVFLMMIFAIFEYGRLFMVRHVMDSAVREAARYAVVNGNTGTVANVTTISDKQMNTIKNALVGSSWTTDVFWIDSKAGNAKKYPFNDAPFGESMGVTITSQFRPALPVMFAGYTAINCKSSCFMLSEAN